MGIWRGLKIGLTIIGTTIGAGFASGREIWEFFASYGQESQYSLWLAQILFLITVIVILGLSAEKQTGNYYGILLKLMGRKLAPVFDVLTMAYLVCMTVVMFAGSGATFSELNLSYMFGVLCLAVTVFIVMLFDVGGLMSIQSLIIPVLTGVLIFVCGHFLMGGQGGPLTPNGLDPWPSGLTYAGLNVVPLIAVISGMGKEIKSKKDLYVAAIVSTLGLTIITVLMNNALMKLGNQVQGFEIPLFSFLNELHPSMMVIVPIMLWLAIYTTALSGVYGIVSRISPYFLAPHWLISLIIILALIPLSQFGFSTLVAILYPIYGVLNLFVLALLILYPISRGFEN